MLTNTEWDSLYGLFKPDLVMGQEPDELNEQEYQQALRRRRAGPPLTDTERGRVMTVARLKARLLPRGVPKLVTFDEGEFEMAARGLHPLLVDPKVVRRLTIKVEREERRLLAVDRDLVEHEAMYGLA